MSNVEMDPTFTAALREVLLATAEGSPRLRRRWRWRLGTGAIVGLTLVGGGVALAAGAFSSPGAPLDTPLGRIVTATRTGTATIDIGQPPAGASDLSLVLTCLTPGDFFFPNGSSASCDRADVRHPPPIDRVASEVVPLSAGVDSVTITTGAHSAWTLQVMYVNQVTTPWGVNASGQTYGVVNQSGTPDLVAVVIDHGNTHGYVKKVDVNCATRGDVRTPAEALAWDKVSRHRNISIPVYQSDGATVIGTFVLGDATGPHAHTVALSTLSLRC